MDAPLITPDVIRWLDSIYPSKVPELSWSDREVWAYVGKVSVVDAIKAAYADQKGEA